MYILKKKNTEEGAVAYFLAPGVKKEDINITANENEVSISMKGNEFWDADSTKVTTEVAIKNVLAHVSDGILAVEIQFDIPKKKQVKVTID